MENHHSYSVLMSVYKNEHPDYLYKSIKSMLAQTVIPQQFVIVKDGPLTKSLDEVVQKFVCQYKDLFKIVELPNNVGLGRALDIGLEHCTNELVARMDSDDISLESRCEKQLHSFDNNPALDIVGTMIDEFYDNPDNIVSTRVVPTEYSEIVKFMRRRSPFNHPSVMFKKSKVINVGGYGPMKRKQDLDLFSRMINDGCYATNINESLVLFRSNENSFVRRKSWSYCKSYIEVQFIILKRKNCSVFDFMYVLIGQLLMYVLPIKVMKALSSLLLRKNRGIRC
ncbi:glycosyltransferase [Exiguobacterium alkaliphilum]|uniref:glycosyltransferase n=1 Tax=Exiguobacterium alkaliphilum TaxID=1428684 RepID=UPI00403ACE98